MTDKRKLCPDGGTCHHACAGAACFRVAHCGPLSGTRTLDRWTDADRARHGFPDLTGPERDAVIALTDALDAVERTAEKAIADLGEEHPAVARLTMMRDRLDLDLRDLRLARTPGAER